MTPIITVRRRGRTLGAAAALLALATLLAPLGSAIGLGGAAIAQDPAPAASGRIVGVVVDASTGEPLSAVLVRLLAGHRADQSHDDGSFSLGTVPPGTYELVAQRIGYAPLRRTIQVAAGEETPLRLALVPTAVTLRPQVVTGTVGERSGDEVLSPTSTVSGQALDRELSGTVANTLRNQPGVAVTSAGPATARPIIRGLGGDRILVLEDGQRPGDMSSTSGDHAVAIEPLTAQRIEVVRGPMSLLYGSSALGGVVNVVRDEVPNELPEDAHGALTVQGTSVARGVSAGGHLLSRVGHVALRGEASARTSGDLRTPSGRLTNTDTRTYSASAGGAYVNGAGYAGLAYRYYQNTYGIPGGFVGGHEEGVDIDMRRHTVRADAERHIEGGLFEDVRVSALATDYRHLEYETHGTVGTAFDQSLVSGDLLARHGAVGPVRLGAVGARVQYRDIRTGGSLRTPNTADFTAAGFLVEEVGTERLRLQGGLRYDWAHFEPKEQTTIAVGGRQVPVRPRTFASVSGSLGLLHVLTDGIRLGASVSRAYRTPDFNELYSDGPHLAANSYDVGDPDLEAETGLGMDAFVRVTRPRVSAEIAVFRNQLNDYVFPSSRGRAEIGSQGGRPRFQYTNEDARFVGIEGEVALSLTRRLVLESSASLVQARFTAPRAPIPVITFEDTTWVPASVHPPLIPPLNGRVDLRYERSRWFAGVGTRWSDRQDRIGDFEEPTAGYAIATATAGVRLLTRERLHSLTLRVENLFDAEYREHTSRTKSIMPGAGRDLTLLYRLTF